MTQFLNLYHYLNVYGSVVQTEHKLKNCNEYIDWTEQNFQYVKYNPRKKIERFGLSLTSLDGGLSGIPDLDSLYEYNGENKTSYSERDFKIFTPAYNFENLKKIFQPIESYIFRSHIIKLKPGGFFPPHRDFRGMNINSFRLIIPLKNMNPPTFNFIIEEKIIYWKYGYVYFVDTIKAHYLFNSSLDLAYMIVLNVDLNEETVNFVTRNLTIK